MSGVRRLFRLNTVLCLFLAGGSCAIAESRLSLAEVMAKIGADREAITNADISSEWTEEWGGSLRSWESQRWLSDDLGRRRLEFRAGSFGPDGERLPADDGAECISLFNGELAYEERFYPSRDRDGGNDASKQLGYRSGVVSDAASPAKALIVARRNPVEYLRLSVLGHLHDLESAGVDAKISTEGELLLIRSDVLRADGMTPTYSEIKIDRSRDWNPVRFARFTESGSPVSEVTVELAEDRGNWYCSSGTHIAHDDRPETPPIFVWKWEVTKASLNDPAFDSSVFELLIPPDTAVADTRYQVAYRIGDEGKLEADLQELAMQARAELGNERKPSIGSAASGAGRSYFLVANVLIFAVVVLVYVVRRFRRIRCITSFLVLLGSLNTCVGVCASGIPLPDNPYRLDERKRCGPDCVVFVAKYLGEQLELGDVLSACEPGSNGTSLHSLNLALEQFGFYTIPFKGLSESDLFDLQSPAIVHLTGEAGQGHFMVILGGDRDQGTLRGFSPPRTYGSFSASELGNQITGLGIAVSNTPSTDLVEQFDPPAYAERLLGSGWITLSLGILALSLVFKAGNDSRKSSAAALNVMLAGACFSPLAGCGWQQDPEGSREIDFGRVPQGEFVEHVFSVRNDTSESFDIVDIKRGCSCQSVTVTPGRTIAAGDAAQISVRFGTDGHEGPLKQRVRLLTNSKAQDYGEIGLSVQCFVDVGVRAIPSQILLANPQRREDRQRKIQLKITKDGIDPDSIISSLSGNPHLSLKRMNESGGLITYLLTLSDRVPVGQIVGQVKFEFVDSDTNDIVIPVIGRRSMGLRVVPPEISVDPRRHFPVTRRILVSSADDSLFRILAVETPRGIELTEAPESIPSDSHTLSLSLNFDKIQTARTSVIIKTDSQSLGDVALHLSAVRKSG